MKLLPSFFFFFVLSVLLSCTQTLHAQTRWIDYTPSYRVDYDYYILDKIEYRAEATVLFFRFVCNNQQYTGATFYSPQGVYPWFLKSKSPNRNFSLREIRNVRRDEQLIAAKVTQPNFSVPSPSREGYTVFTCEIHFEPLPDNIKEVDLIEGRGMEESNNFNCFNLKIKQRTDPTLGTEQQRQQQIYNFEKKFGIERNKPTEPIATKPDNKKPNTPEKPTEPNKKTEVPAAPSLQSNGKTLAQAEDLGCDKALVLQLLFADNSTRFQQTVIARNSLSWVAEFMKKNPKAKLEIHGHTDIFGNAEANMDLSKRRADVVMRELGMQSVHLWRMEARGYGGSQPLNAKGGAENRRVEILLICPQ